MEHRCSGVKHAEHCMNVLLDKRPLDAITVSARVVLTSKLWKEHDGMRLQTEFEELKRMQPLIRIFVACNQNTDRCATMFPLLVFEKESSCAHAGLTDYQLDVAL
jgi:hypothetical protein